MTKQEQIEEMAELIIGMLDRETVDKFIEDGAGNLVGVITYSLYDTAEMLYNAGFRKVEEKDNENDND